MKDRIIIAVAILVCTLLVHGPGVAFADGHKPLKDASFEQQLAADDGGWAMFENSSFSTGQARTGEQSMFNGAFSRTIAYPPYFVGSVSGSFQEFAATPGSRWRLSGYGLAANALKGTPAFGVVQITFFNADGVDLGTVETVDASANAKTSNEVNNQSPAGEWIALDTGVATAPDGTASVQAFTLYVDFSGSNTAQGVYFDDLTLCALDDNEDDCK